MLRFHIHYGARCAADTNWRKRGGSAHLRQGSIDRATGSLSVLMALIVLGLATLQGVRDRHLRAEVVEPDEFWPMVHAASLIDCDAADMIALLSTLGRHIEYEVVSGSMRDITKFALHHLARSELVLLGLDHAFAYGKHWVLAIGEAITDSTAGSETTAILCLDANESPPMLAPFNTQLDLLYPRRGSRHVRYLVQDGRSQLVTCRTAVSLRRAGLVTP